MILCHADPNVNRPEVAGELHKDLRASKGREPGTAGLDDHRESYFLHGTQIRQQGSRVAYDHIGDFTDCGEGHLIHIDDLLTDHLAGDTLGRLLSEP